MHLPKISIITPSYNQGRYIEQTILSVLNQNYPNLEYIIIDGGSTDETVDIIKKYASHITYWVSEKDQGQTEALNKGFAKCTGDIFNWINSDDFYEPCALMEIGTLFKDNPAVDVVCGKEWSFKDTVPEEKTLNEGSVVAKDIFETIRIGIIDQPCTFFRLNKINDFFPLDVSLKYAMDRQLWWSYLLKFGQQNILQTSEVFTNFRLHGQSKSVSDGDLFETEYDSLRVSLFRSLEAPAILEKQLAKNTMPVNINWHIGIQRPDFVLAAFAAYYAERHYVKDDLETTGMLMKYVKSIKKRNLNQQEKKMWWAANAIPHSLLLGLKKLKKLKKSI